MLALDASDSSAVEVGEDAELAEGDEIAFTAEGGGHAGEVADRGDEGAEASAEGFAVGGSAEVVVAAAGAGGVGGDLDLPAAGSELQHRLAVPAAAVSGSNVDRLAVAARAAARSSRARASRLGLSPWSEGARSRPRR